MNENGIGRRMADLRRRKGLTMRRVAELTGISQGQISRLESGRQGFRSETLVRIARALGVEPYRLCLPAGWEDREAPGPELTGALTEALREPEFVSLLEDVARACRASPGKFQAIRSVTEIVLNLNSGALASPAAAGRPPARRRS